MSRSFGNGTPATQPAWPAALPPVGSHCDLAPLPTRRKIKVLHVITRFSDGAGGNTLLSVLGSDRNRYEMWVAGAPTGPLWERTAAAGVKSVKLDRLREVISPLDLRVLVALVRLIRTEHFTIVHTHFAKAGFLGRLAAHLCRTPVVGPHDPRLQLPRFHERTPPPSVLGLERLARRMTDAFIAVAPEVALEAVRMRLARPETVSVVPSAIELTEIPSRADPALRADLGMPRDAPLIGTVGRLDFQKAPLDFARMGGWWHRSDRMPVS